MENKAMQNSDGEMLIVPQAGYAVGAPSPRRPLVC
jgi:homogentisate 1,2-dioxygenase